MGAISQRSILRVDGCVDIDVELSSTYFITAMKCTRLFESKAIDFSGSDVDVMVTSFT